MEILLMLSMIIRKKERNFSLRDLNWNIMLINLHFHSELSRKPKWDITCWLKSIWSHVRVWPSCYSLWTFSLLKGEGNDMWVYEKWISVTMVSWMYSRHFWNDVIDVYFSSPPLEVFISVKCLVSHSIHLIISLSSIVEREYGIKSMHFSLYSNFLTFIIKISIFWKKNESIDSFSVHSMARMNWMIRLPSRKMLFSFRRWRERTQV